MLKPKFFIDRFVTPIESYYGLNSTKAVTAIRNTKSAILTINSLTKLPHFDQFMAYLQCDASLVIESPFIGEPTKEEVFKVLEKLETFQPDVIYAVGGGSIIDGAKIMSFFLEHGNLEYDEYERSFPPDVLNKIDLYAVPTTCGTGSEVSSSAILKDSQKKRAIVTHDFLPKAFFLDPGFLITLPEAVKIETAADAMTHAIEGFVSTIDNPLMNVFAVNALSLIRTNLFKSLENPSDTDALLNLQMAATFAGYVQNHCLVGLCHAISHALGTFGYSHGYLNLSLINSIITFNCKQDNTKNKYQQLFNDAGFKSINDAQNFLVLLQSALNRKKPEKKQITEMIQEDILQEIIDDKLTEVNPVKPELSDISKIIISAYED